MELEKLSRDQILELPIGTFFDHCDLTTILFTSVSCSYLVGNKDLLYLMEL